MLYILKIALCFKDDQCFDCFARKKDNEITHPQVCFKKIYEHCTPCLCGQETCALHFLISFLMVLSKQESKSCGTAEKRWFLEDRDYAQLGSSWIPRNGPPQSDCISSPLRAS